MVVIVHEVSVVVAVVEDVVVVVIVCAVSTTRALFRASGHVDA